MSQGYDFDKEHDEGIFDNPEERGAGDPEATADFIEEGAVPALVIGIGQDGLPMTLNEEPDLAGEPLQCSWRELLCLAGPCRHYTENIRPIDVGEPECEVSRWCGRLRTWAEQTSLNEATIYGCTGYDPIVSDDPEVMKTVAEATSRCADEMASIRREALDQKVDLGICVIGPCDHFVEVVRRPSLRDTSEVDRESNRYCTRLAGLGRLYDVRELPVYACTAYSPKGESPAVAMARGMNRGALEAFRKKMATRTNNEDTNADPE